MGIAVIDRLHEAISALAAVDLDSLTDRQLDELTVQLQRATTPSGCGGRRCRHAAGRLAACGCPTAPGRRRRDSPAMPGRR